MNTNEYKEVQVRYPEASGFCGRASRIYPSLAQRASKSFQGNISLKLINRSTENHRKFWASRYDLWASTSCPKGRLEN